MVVVEKGVLWRAVAGAVSHERHCIATGRAYRQSLRKIANHHLIDDARRVHLHFNDRDRIHLAIGQSITTAGVVDQAEPAIRHNLDIVGIDAGEYVVALVGHLGAIDIEKRHPVRQGLSHQRALAVGRYGDGGHLLAGCMGGRSATVSTTVTVLPEMVSRLTVLSARLATSARLPAWLIAMPDGCLPVWIVDITAGGDVVGR